MPLVFFLILLKTLLWVKKTALQSNGKHVGTNKSLHSPLLPPSFNVVFWGELLQTTLNLGAGGKNIVKLMILAFVPIVLHLIVDLKFVNVDDFVYG